LLERVSAGEVIVADRNFCTRGLMEGIAGRGACFVIRHHEGSALESPGEMVHAGPAPTGEVFEQAVVVGGTAYRLIIVRLTTPTTGGDTEIRLLTNLPADRFPARAVAEAYRLRWTIEATFLEVTRNVQCELNTLGYPKGALLTFALALCASNTVRVVTRALELAQGADHPDEEVSGYYMVNELIASHDGMDVTLPESVWTSLRTWTAK
jgi:hypothetical protein